MEIMQCVLFIVAVPAYAHQNSSSGKRHVHRPIFLYPSPPGTCIMDGFTLLRHLLGPLQTLNIFGCKLACVPEWAQPGSPHSVALGLGNPRLA